jgi:hypothetical protein
MANSVVVAVESEPNNTSGQANNAGELSPGHDLVIGGHLNGHSDPVDYFSFTATEAGRVSGEVIDANGNVISHNTYAVDPGQFELPVGTANPNSDFDYALHLSYIA